MTTTGSARPPGRHKRLFFSSSECFTRCGNLAHSIECTGGHCLGRPQLHFPLLYSSAPDPNLVSLCSSDPELTPLVTIFVNKSSPCVTSRLSRRLVFTCIVISELKSWFVFDKLLSLHVTSRGRLRSNTVAVKVFLCSMTSSCIDLNLSQIATNSSNALCALLKQIRGGFSDEMFFL